MTYYEAARKFASGLIEREQGRLDLAKTHVSEMESALSRLDPERNSEVAFLRDLLSSEIALAEGMPRTAADIFGKSTLFAMPISHPWKVDDIFYNTPFLKDVLARAYVQMGELDKAVGAYEGLITIDPKTDSRFLIHPRYHYRLAKLYEQKGMRDKARGQYQRFIDLWKDADPGILEVEDARKRLTDIS